jgi:hypothetical protein
MNSKVCQRSQLILRDTDTPEEQPTGVSPKSIGLCPFCGTEQVGAIYRISAKLAAFLKVTRTETFIPDEHHCRKNAAA